MRCSLFLFLIACGEDPVFTPIDAMPADSSSNPLCLVEGDYGDVGTLTGTTSLGPTTSTIVLDQGPPRDSFFLKLTDGMGVFAGGLATGTFTIAGAELAPTTCGVCVNLLADIGSMGPAKFFFATGGTVTLSSHTPPAGTISNVTMRETTSGGAPIVGGCTTTIGAMAFSTQ